MRIYLTSVPVDDQQKAQEFYTTILGFITKTDIPAGEFRWLTLVSADHPDGPELLLEPDGNPAIDDAARAFKKTLFGAGIPYTSFAVDDILKEFARLKNLGVRFTMEPTALGPVTAAVFDDTCGNLIQIVQL